MKMLSLTVRTLLVLAGLVVVSTPVQAHQTLHCEFQTQCHTYTSWLPPWDTVTECEEVLVCYYVEIPDLPGPQASNTTMPGDRMPAMLALPWQKEKAGKPNKCDRYPSRAASVATAVSVVRLPGKRAS